MKRVTILRLLAVSVVLLTGLFFGLSFPGDVSPPVGRPAGCLTCAGPIIVFCERSGVRRV